MSDRLDFTKCRVCGAALSELQVEQGRLRYQAQLCSADCTATEIKRAYACCEKAEFTPCVCMYSFECTEHGVTHVGTHD